jgi:hypothetical protein
MADRPQEITLAEMRDMGVRGVLIYCSDYRWPTNRRAAGWRALDTGWC